MIGNNLYKLPLCLNNIFEDGQGYLDRCSDKESIDQNIELLIATCPGEHHFDENYGSHIWDLDFERVHETERWKEIFTSHVVNAINKYEPRLTNVSVTSNMVDVVKEDRIMESVTVRKRVDIYVTGQLSYSDEWCRFVYAIYLGPLSVQ